MTLDDLINFLDERPAISVKKIEEESGMPQSYLGKIKRGERSLTKENIDRLIPVLKKYGYKV